MYSGRAFLLLLIVCCLSRIIEGKHPRVLRGFSKPQNNIQKIKSGTHAEGAFVTGPSFSTPLKSPPDGKPKSINDILQSHIQTQNQPETRYGKHENEPIHEIDNNDPVASKDPLDHIMKHNQFQPVVEGDDEKYISN